MGMLINIGRESRSGIESSGLAYNIQLNNSGINNYTRDISLS